MALRAAPVPRPPQPIRATSIVLFSPACTAGIETPARAVAVITEDFTASRRVKLRSLTVCSCDVGMEADAGIFVTETDAALNLVLAHANGGDIRLTVRESADLDEHLNLLQSGSALFFEDPPDSPRPVPHGQIFAGSLELHRLDGTGADIQTDHLLGFS